MHEQEQGSLSQLRVLPPLWPERPASTAVGAHLPTPVVRALPVPARPGVDQPDDRRRSAAVAADHDHLRWDGLMRRVLAVLAVAVLSMALQGASCGSRPPKPTPTPTPPPPPAPAFVHMLLRTCGTGQFCAGGAPIDFAGCEACCMEWEDGRSGWPLISTPFVDWCQKQGRANFFHARPGPFNVADEPEWAEFGGPYVEVNGKADITQFNPKFWTELERLTDDLGQKGAWLEIDLIDSWRLKGACDYSSWAPFRNVQGQDHCANTHRGPGDGVHDAWLRQVVATVGRFGNVVFQIGNESGLVAGKNAGLIAWEQWVRDRVRVHEQEVGLGVVHMIGTNSEFDELESATFIDYVNRHGSVPSEPAFSKPTANNELNPAPTPPSAFLSLYCAARKGGAYYWAWRGELPRPEWDAVLAGISQARLNNCADVNTDACPFALPTIRVVQAKNHYEAPGQVNLDATPLGGDAQYCREVGFTDGRSICPVRMEGDAFRGQCELAAMGGEISWAVTAPLSIEPRQYSFQAVVTGPRGASGTVTCTFPKAGGENKCARPASAGGGPVVVTIP